MTPEEKELNERAIKEYDDFAESRLAAGDTPGMMRDSAWAALHHVATDEQLSSMWENRHTRDIREPEFEQFVLATQLEPFGRVVEVVVARFRSCDYADTGALDDEAALTDHLHVFVDGILEHLFTSVRWRVEDGDQVRAVPLSETRCCCENSAVLITENHRHDGAPAAVTARREKHERPITVLDVLHNH